MLHWTVENWLPSLLTMRFVSLARNRSRDLNLLWFGNLIDGQLGLVDLSSKNHLNTRRSPLQIYAYSYAMSSIHSAVLPGVIDGIQLVSFGAIMSYSADCSFLTLSLPLHTVGFPTRGWVGFWSSSKHWYTADVQFDLTRHDFPSGRFSSLAETDLPDLGSPGKVRGVRAAYFSYGCTGLDFGRWTFDLSGKFRLRTSSGLCYCLRRVTPIGSIVVPYGECRVAIGGWSR